MTKYHEQQDKKLYTEKAHTYKNAQMIALMDVETYWAVVFYSATLYLLPPKVHCNYYNSTNSSHWFLSNFIEVQLWLIVLLLSNDAVTY